jgi:hypothetical protein
MRGTAVAILAAVAALEAACGHYSAPVRPGELSPDVGPVYNAGQPPDTAEERREQRLRERQRQRRPQSPLQTAPPPAAPAPAPAPTP